MDAEQQHPPPSPSPPPPSAANLTALPLELLQKCLDFLAEREHRRAAFRACKRFAKALLLSKPRSMDRWDLRGLRLNLAEAHRDFARSARLLHELVGAEEQHIVLMLSSYDVDQWSCLAESGAVLTCVTTLALEGSRVSQLLPPGVDRLLPNLRHVVFEGADDRRDPPAVSLVDASCVPPRLSQVEMRDVTVGGVDAWRTLALLPSLTSLKVEYSSFPTAALDSLSSKLTALDLSCTSRDYEDGVLPSWEEFVRPVAACTRLHSLAFPCPGAKELRIVAAALPQLQRLHLGWTAEGSEGGGDAMVEALLGLPHLTSLQWDACESVAFKRNHAGSPCRWRELRFALVTPHQLARLPLHSLTSPVAWVALFVTPETTVAEVEAAAANVQRNSRRGCTWVEDSHWDAQGLLFSRADGSMLPSDPFIPAPGATTAALLRAASPLLAGAAGTPRTLQVYNVPWDVEEVRALGEALPRACTELSLWEGSVTPLACVELARSLPWLAHLSISSAEANPAAVAAYVGLLKGQAQGAGQAMPLRSLGVFCITNDQPEREAWAAVRVLVQAMGVRMAVPDL